MQRSQHMNLKRLKEAEAAFLKRYPGGFTHPEMIEVVKKHQPEKMRRLAAERFAKAKFSNTDELVEAMIKTTTQSSMVSVFEKPRFRDVVRTFSGAQKQVLAKGLKELLHGNQQKGFNTLVDVLDSHKLAKWTLITAIPSYYRPDEEVFVKPTTTKKIITNLELDLEYNAHPSWEFYEPYREIINKLKKKVSKTLTPSNAAFCGFLMYSFE
jgi:hypothetical protein